MASEAVKLAALQFIIGETKHSPALPSHIKSLLTQAEFWLETHQGVYQNAKENSSEKP